VISSSQGPLPDNTHNRQTSMCPVGFEPTIAVGEPARPLGPADKNNIFSNSVFLYTHIYIYE
jgi:hypothetical protein